MKRLALLCALLLAPAFALAQAPTPANGQLDRLQRADGAKVVPERFLRSWDPVTIFFDRDLGPLNGGTEDAPEKFVTLQPAAAAAWQWLGPRALPFRPAEAGKPPQHLHHKADGRTARQVPVLPVPASRRPSVQAAGSPISARSR